MKKLLILYVTIVVLTQAATAQILINAGFEQPIQTHPDGFSNIGPGGEPIGFGWTIAAGNVDLVGSYWPAAAGNQSLDLNGFLAGSIFQDVLFANGGIYRVNFQFSGNPAAAPAIKEMRIDFGPVAGSLTDVGTFSFDTTGHDLTNLGWRPEQSADLVVSAGTVYRLQFTSLITGSYGPLLDDISIVQVPEPAASLLVLIGTFAWNNRKRFV